jgi:hypothetical protein
MAMSNVGTSYIEIRAKLDRFERDLKDAESTALKGGTALGSNIDSGLKSKLSGLSDFGKRLGKGLAIAGGAALAGLAVAGKAAFDAAQEAAQIGAQTEAVLKSTGGAANLTAREIERLAGRISAYSAVEDDAIQSGANLLLTFTNIKDAAGANNDVFSQATTLMTDMSVAMGQDMKASAIQLGKALNDPIKGVGALSRVGVQFTEKQREQIEAMVDSGKTMKAQKIILGELTTQFGGSARKIGDTKPWDKMKNAVGEVMESIGTALMPTIETLATRLRKFIESEKFQAWLEKASKWLQEKLPEAIEAVVRFVRQDLMPAFETITGAIGNFVGLLRDSYELLKKISKLTGVANAIKSLIPGGGLLGIAGSPTAKGDFGNTPTAWANTAMAAVPGFQTITSGYRPGDTGSYHSTPPPYNAVDIGGENLSGTFTYLAATVGQKVRELIYGHSIIERGQLGYYAPNDHFDHVHMADMGAIIKGPALIAQGNITEAHIPLTGPGAKSLGPTIHIHGDVYGFNDFMEKVNEALSVGIGLRTAI